MNKKVIGIIVGAIALIIGFIWFTQPSEQAAGTPSNHTLGSDSSGVVLIEYGDFQCPACGSYHPILQQVKEAYKDRVLFQFRHFPLEAIHVNARAGSRAAEAASMQNKFWEMHDMLFENQTAWSGAGDPLSIFESYAQALGLDVAKFTTDYKSSTVNATINADITEGKNLGAESTPTFILDGEKIENPGASAEAFAALLDEAIAKKSGQDTSTEPTTTEPATTPEETNPTQ
jgi:protein-disulfide isomerase